MERNNEAYKDVVYKPNIIPVNTVFGKFILLPESVTYEVQYLVRMTGNACINIMGHKYNGAYKAMGNLWIVTLNCGHTINFTYIPPQRDNQIWCYRCDYWAIVDLVKDNSS